MLIALYLILTHFVMIDQIRKFCIKNIISVLSPRFKLKKVNTLKLGHFPREILGENNIWSISGCTKGFL